MYDVQNLPPATPDRTYDFPVGEDVEDTPKAWEKVPWRPLLVGVVVAAAIGVGFLVPTVKTVPGVVTASKSDVSVYAAEVKAADEAAKQAADKAALTQLETEVRSGMQGYFDEPANAMGDRFTVSKVVLFKTGDTTYEGVARMSVNGGVEKDIDIHVTADDRNLLWKTDEGALLPLFR